MDKSGGEILVTQIFAICMSNEDRIKLGRHEKGRAKLE